MQLCPLLGGLRMVMGKFFPSFPGKCTLEPSSPEGQGGICRNTFYLVEAAKTPRRLGNCLTLQNNLFFSE